jgi:hypothetical protein
MAILEQVSLKNVQLNPASLEDNVLDWISVDNKRVIPKLPQIFFGDGEPWMAANEFAIAKLQDTKGNDLKTVISNMNHLKAYASWLEGETIDWRHFPTKKKDRCLFRYRGRLIEQRKAGLLSPSTATTGMAAIIRFYRWAQIYGWV